VRAGELVAEFKRFDDDTKSSLRGEHVWDALVHAGRATKTGGLSAEYLAALLDTFDRALTPREVVQSFYKNPAFSLVRSTDDIRRAVYDLLHEGWELIDSDSNPLAIASPSQISINSIQQTLRRRTNTAPLPATGIPTPAGPDVLWSDDGGPIADAHADDDPYRAAPGTHVDTSSTSGTTVTTAYKRYIVELTNRSITSPEAREQVWQLLRELAKVIDTANIAADHQLLSLSLTLTTAEGHQGQIETKARQAEARVRVEDDEF
jgi:transposase